MHSSWLRPIAILTALLVAPGCVSSNASVDAAANTPTQILVPPTDVVVTEPASAMFSAEVTGAAPLIVVWQRSDDGTTWTDLGAAATVPTAPATVTHTTGATSASDDGAQFRISVRGATDVAATLSSVATLSVTPGVAPTLVTDVRDVAVPEGATATFVAAASGGGLTFAWEEAPAAGAFQPIAGGAACLPLPGVTTLMDGRRYRVTISNSVGAVTSREARLTVFPTGGLAEVYAQVAPPNSVVRDPALAMATAVGTESVADLAAGTFGGRADAMANPGAGRDGYSGISRELIFVNTTGASVTIPAGAVRLQVTGSYAHTMAPFISTGAYIRSNLVAVVGGVIYRAEGTHQWARTYDALGTPLPTSYSTFTPANQNGGTAVAPSFDISGVTMELLLPALVVPATEQLRLSAAVYASAGDRAMADALTVPSALTLKLPAGVSFDRNTAVPLSWVTNLP